MVLPPFEQTALEDLASRITDTHSLAYEWNAADYWDQTGVLKYVSLFLERSDPRKVRSFVRSLVYVLDVVEERREKSVLEDMLDKLEFERED